MSHEVYDNFRASLVRSKWNKGVGMSGKAPRKQDQISKFEFRGTALDEIIDEANRLEKKGALVNYSCDRHFGGWSKMAGVLSRILRGVDVIIGGVGRGYAM